MLPEYITSKLLDLDRCKILYKLGFVSDEPYGVCTDDYQLFDDSTKKIPAIMSGHSLIPVPSYYQVQKWLTEDYGWSIIVLKSEDKYIAGCFSTNGASTIPVNLGGPKETYMDALKSAINTVVDYLDIPDVKSI